MAKSKAKPAKKDPQQLRLARAYEAVGRCEQACDRVLKHLTNATREATLTPCDVARLRRQAAELALGDAYLALAATFQLIGDLALYRDEAAQKEMELCHGA